eukprot:1908500-Ditylum_brightwellii.AAC.1
MTNLIQNIIGNIVKENLPDSIKAVVQDSSKQKDVMIQSVTAPVISTVSKITDDVSKPIASDNETQVALVDSETQTDASSFKNKKSSNFKKGYALTTVSVKTPANRVRK